jgi:hypothetical protein
VSQEAEVAGGKGREESREAPREDSEDRSEGREGDEEGEGSCAMFEGRAVGGFGGTWEVGVGRGGGLWV